MAIHSLAGALEPGDDLLTRPPFSAPHHDASKVSLIGGGTGRVRPGEVSRAHCGVLFLDEFPLFRTDVIEALRQPLESGEITIARGDDSATFPARGMVVFACNPCPCGDYSDDHGHQQVHAASRSSAATTARGSPARSPTGSTSFATSCRSSPHDRPEPWVAPESSASDPGAGRAGARCGRRTATTDAAGASTPRRPGRCCATSGRWLRDAQRRLDDELYSGRLSRRGATRVHRLAWTVADLAGVDQPGLRRGRHRAPASLGRPRC